MTPERERHGGRSFDIPSDIDADAHAIQRELYRKMGGRGRAAVAFRLTDLVRRRSVAGIRAVIRTTPRRRFNRRTRDRGSVTRSCGRSGRTSRPSIRESRRSGAPPDDRHSRPARGLPSGSGCFPMASCPSAATGLRNDLVSGRWRLDGVSWGVANEDVTRRTGQPLQSGCRSCRSRARRASRRDRPGSHARGLVAILQLDVGVGVG